MREIDMNDQLLNEFKEQKQDNIRYKELEPIDNILMNIDINDLMNKTMFRIETELGNIL